MQTISLYPKNPRKAWIWTKKGYLQDTAFRKTAVGERIKPRVSPEGQTSWFLGHELLWDGCVIMEDGMVLPMEEVVKRYEVGEDGCLLSQTREKRG